MKNLSPSTKETCDQCQNELERVQNNWWWCERCKLKWHLDTFTVLELLGGDKDEAIALLKELQQLLKDEE